MDVTILSANPLVAKISGRIDTVTADDFHKKAEKIMSDNPGNVTFDCVDLAYVSSSGLRVLLLLARKAKAAGAVITLKGLSTSVQEVMEISGFDSFFEIEE